MQKKQKNKIEYIGYILITIGVILIVIYLIIYLIEKNKTNEQIEDYIEATDSIINTVTNTDEIEIQVKDEKEIFMVLEIPKINLEKGIYYVDSKYNDVEHNVELLKESITPDKEKSNVILASHNGNSKVSYFNKLYKLNFGDKINIYYKGIKYIYKIANIYDIEKDGIAEIYRDKDKQSITLITCKKNTKDKQQVYIGYLDNSYEY